MTFLRTSASCTPSNFGTPTRLGAASATVEKRAPSSSAKTPIGTRRAFVVTRTEFRLRKDSFTRTLTRGWVVPYGDGEDGDREATDCRRSDIELRGARVTVKAM